MTGGQRTGPSPVDRGMTGSKHHVITDAHGIPLAATLTGANRHDVTQLLPLVHAAPRSKASAGVPAAAPRRCTPTAATTTTSTDAGYSTWASARSSPAAEPSTAPAWASTAGSSKPPSPSCTTSAVCAPAGCL
ncbi:transposase [Streptomyces broussonetiae]